MLMNKTYMRATTRCLKFVVRQSPCWSAAIFTSNARASGLPRFERKMSAAVQAWCFALYLKLCKSTDNRNRFCWTVEGKDVGHLKEDGFPWKLIAEELDGDLTVEYKMHFILYSWPKHLYRPDIYIYSLTPDQQPLAWFYFKVCS